VRFVNAFTLLEVMLALAISAVVLAGIGTVFYSAMRLRERTTAMVDEAQPLQQALNFLRIDLRGALPPGGSSALAQDFRVEGSGSGTSLSSRLQFFTTSGILRDNQPWGDLQVVAYEVRDSGGGPSARGKELIRSVTRNLLASGAQETQDQFLMGNVESMEVTCYDGSNWQDTWDTSLSNTNLPTAVRLRIQLSGAAGMGATKTEPYEIVVPLVCEARTNQTSTAAGGAGQ
jgi:type II secretion system protein J